MDLVGPLELKVGDCVPTFHALTAIDVVTNLVELVRLDDKSSPHVTVHFENAWLACHPRPTRCICDQGREFTG